MTAKYVYNLCILVEVVETLNVDVPFNVYLADLMNHGLPKWAVF